MIPKPDLEDLYGVMSITEISDKLSVSRPTVYSWLRKYGIDIKPTKVEIVCHTCRGKKLILISVFVLSEKHFCCKSCYTDYLRSDEHRAEQDRKRVARVEQKERNTKAGL